MEPAAYAHGGSGFVSRPTQAAHSPGKVCAMHVALPPRGVCPHGARQAAGMLQESLGGDFCGSPTVQKASGCTDLLPPACSQFLG